MATKYYPSKVRVWMKLTQDDGTLVEVPISGVSLRFALNTIPAAMVDLAVGVNMAKPFQKSNAHKVSTLCRRGTPAQIFCALEGVAGKVNGKVCAWPGLTNGFRIFDGYISSAGPDVGPGGLKSSLGLTHWLNKLDETCWISSVLDPGAADSLWRPTGWSMDPSGPPIAWLTSLSSPTGKESSEYFVDFWGKGVKPELIAVASGKAKQWTEIQQSRMGFIEALYGMKDTNELAVAILKKLDDPKHTVVCPLPLFGGQSGYTSGAALLPKVVTAVAQMFWSMEGSPTLWSKMLRFVTSMMCGFSPSVETATVFPYVPVLNAPWLTLEAEDIWGLSNNVMMPQQIRGVVLLPRMIDPWGTKQGSSSNPSAGGRRNIVGFYDVTQPDSGIPASLIGKSPGKLIVDYIYPWLELDIDRREAEAISKQIVTARHPQKPKPDKTQKMNEARRPIGDAMAKALFMLEAFKFRAGGLTSRLRFDTAPGSTILYKPANGVYDVPGFTGQGILANVSVVHIQISANPADCKTTFETSHLRLAHETAFHLDAHPLFKNSWRGGPLINIPHLTPPLVK